ncbi:hypothetical protein GGE66_000556 [Rhizobium leguminosarum]|uniref:Uncharacterized protein n=1 Tax=Rhizobium leguminosarum TaxID=384 RepID=A0A7X0DSK5_RHILE|nr:hypothetical protein [Rhizobium leguminosarum]
MPKQDVSSRHFQRKISDFCDVRIAPIASKQILENIKLFLISLIIYRKSPPLLNGRLDWTTIGDSCGIEVEMTAELKNHLRPALDAILRWLRLPPAAENIRHSKPTKPNHRTPAPTASSTRKPQRLGCDNAPTQPASASPGPQPKPIQEFPEPLFEAVDDPESFQDALIYQIRRFGDSYWQLYRSIIRLGENFDHKTLLSWIQGERAPRSIASFDILSRIERRYRLPQGYFKAKLPHQSRSLNGHDLGDISPAERRRLAWHLPDDFGSLPFSKREEILDWVRRVIISGSTDYRRY